MKALTVRQPWAEAIADGFKLVENRSQGFPKKYRGPLAIHAGLGWSRHAVYDERIRAAWHDGHHPSPFGENRRNERNMKNYAIRHVPPYGGRPPWPFRGGVVLAVCELVDIHPASDCCEPWGEETYPPATPEARPPGRVTHLVLEDVRRLAHPVPARGALGLWTIDADLAEEIARQLPTEQTPTR